MLKYLRKRLGLSNGALVGCGAFIAAGMFAVVDIRLAAIPLAGFVILSFTAPFLPGFSFFLPVVSRGSSGRRAVALTFDDGPDPLTTPVLLRLLREHKAQGTFFVTGRKAYRHPDLIKEILTDGHCLGNHSFDHDVLIAFKRNHAVLRDIQAVQETLARHGVLPLLFRPPAGVTGPSLQRALRVVGLSVVNFSCRARDGGNRRLKHLAKRILRRVRPDDIVLLHDIAPSSADQLPFWIAEIERILEGVRSKGLAVIPLAELIGKPVMAKAPPASADPDGQRTSGSPGSPATEDDGRYA